jgi:MFS family permease
MAAPSPDPTQLRRFLRGYLAYVFLFDFMLAYAIYTALFQLRGLSLSEIGILLAFWSATAIVLEVPSGALSDHFDRRWLLVAAPLAKALTFVCWALADGNFWLYGLGFLFWSVGQSLFSGSKEALLYERLDADGQAHAFDRMLGRDHAANQLGIGLGALIGGFVAYVSMEATLWLCLPPLVAGAVVALGLRDPRRAIPATDEDGDDKSFGTHFSNAIAEFRNHPWIRFLTLYVAGGLIVLEILEEFDQLYYLAVGLPIWAFGIVDFAVLGVHALASVLAHRLRGRAALGWLLPAVAGLMLIAAAQAPSVWLLIPLVLAYIVIAPANVLAEARFQEVMEGTSRATTTSALVVAQNVTGIALTLGFGYLAELIGILPGYGWAGAYLLVVSVWALWQRARGFSATG